MFHEDETSERCFLNVGNRMKSPLRTFNSFDLVRVRDIGWAHESLKMTL